MLATENLMKEHQLILKYVDLMERYAKFSLKHPDTPVLMERAAGFIEFIHEFADHFHHAKEEDILFRYLGSPGVLTHCNPVPQMLMEHDKGREYVRNMERALQAKELNDLADNAVQYARLLKEHIYKEDNILYPMGENGLSDEAKTALLEEYAETDRRLNSPSLWNKYETFYTELELGLDTLAD
ncbi:hemerythrin domain-containing protein [Methylobacter sp.]|uniref:hemerythrin domain-containing protein n=1 Tax=Methylobacter sp. TaxID=2051955 RepID=UPI001216F221|nr:hemerythrin domain-containing protein [Methylobacter sp.]TAK63314.1 MAG: cation-binding protein [Methylobacter sp.]